MKPVIRVGVGPLGYAIRQIDLAEEEMAATDVPQDAAAQRKKQFFDRGESVTSWAKSHGFDGDMAAVYRVLNGQSPARRGKHHQIAVKLGIKPDPSKTAA